VEILPVQGAQDLRRFIRVPFDRYRNDPYWVAPLPSDELTRLTPGKNPYFEHAEAAYFLAREGGRDIGRVTVSVDRNYDEFQKERQATFGFFEAESPEITAGLLAAADRWARERGAEVLRGPMSFTTNDECGLLVEGFDRPPSIMMPYNPPDYAGWIESAGLAKAKDLLSFHVDVPDPTPPVFERMSAIARKQDGVVTRGMNMKRFKEELGLVKKVYNSAWSANWGFVPMTDAEIDHMAAQLKPAVVPELVRFAEVDGEPVGFCIVIPDVNVALAKIRGKLFPFGIVRLLWNLPRIRAERFMALGIRNDYRKKGVAPLLIAEATEASRRHGMKTCEIGWTLEDNDLVNRVILSFGAVRSTVHRIYERRLAA
jgi:GNAT superfamily N-acetyltransferase